MLQNQHLIYLWSLGPRFPVFYCSFFPQFEVQISRNSQFPQMNPFRYHATLLKSKTLLLLQAVRYARLRRKQQRRFYVRQFNVDREQDGEFRRRVKRMREVDPQIHREYFRMTKEQFDLILDKIRDRIAHHNNHRYPISPEERLAVTIRYVFFVFLMLLQWYQAASLEVRQ